jgi:hypothetical protein
LLHGRTFVPPARQGVVAMGNTPLISEFLNFLAENPDQEAKFDKHPKRVMTQFGLTDEQQQLILHGNLRDIRKAIKKERPEPNVQIFMIKMK